MNAGREEAVVVGLSATTLRIMRRLREANDWRQEIDDALAILGRALRCHRAIVFHMRDIYGKGFAQSIAAVWVDLSVPGIPTRPTTILQSTFNDDPLLERVGQEVRLGKVFAGHTRDLEGYLRQDFERQMVRSFLSVSIFAHGHLWGTLAVNDCVDEREWTQDEVATLEVIALAIGDAIERSSSEDHVSEIFRTTMLQGALDGVVVIDESGGIIEFNPAAEQMFGWSKADVIGRNIAQTLIPREHRQGHASGMNRYLTGGAPVMIGRRVETHGMAASGETFPIELTISEVRAAGRKLFVGSIRDLRERQHAEEEINRQREKLHQNEKMAAMGSLLAGVSHELNNPLAVVVAQSTLLYEFASDPQVRARAEKVRAAAERCGRIVKSFLGMVRLHPTQQTETDLNQVVRTALEVTAYGARSSGITLETDLSPTPVVVMADLDHLTQVIANFLVNAQHALAPVNGPRRILVRTWAAEGGKACFSVEDSGPGIPAAIRDRIFEPYFTTKPVGVGTGIGLSISRSIVDRHGGRLWYEDAQPSGARFVVELPSVGAGARASNEATAASTGIRRALIIDDEPDVASSLADILELMGIKTTVLSAWTGASDVLATRPDVVFCDLRMPTANGMRIFRELMAADATMSKRFALVTGDTIGAKGEIEALPAHQRPLLLEKPFSTLDVRGALAAIGDQIAVAAK